MPAQPVTLDSFSWPTQTAALATFRDILRNSGYEVGDRVDNPVHDLMLREVIERHPDRDEKVGVGIDHFYIGLTADGDRIAVRPDAIGIWIRRTDGTTVDFSYQTAVRGGNLKTDAKEAMRLAVEEIRYDYRDAIYAAGGPVFSDLTGAEISARPDAQVIYLDPTWGQLTYRFAESEGGWSAIATHSGHGGVRVGGGFEDKALEQRWLDFHAAHVQYGLATINEAARRTRESETAWTP
jgi:hypothetical protein